VRARNIVRARRTRVPGTRALKFKVSRPKGSAAVLFLVCSACYGQEPPAEITKDEATRIALEAAGCKKPQDCVAKGRFDKNKWVFVVSYVTGRDVSGKPYSPLVVGWESPWILKDA
jgi:hypothetical protein